MKNKFLVIALLFTLSLYSQNSKPAKVKDLFSPKIGLLGAWMSYEKSLSSTTTVNSEVGYEGGLIGGDYIITSTLSVEPRWYYNFNKRTEKGKNTNLNSANYLGLDLIYVPDFLTATSRDNVDVTETFSILPKWGLRRSISNQWFFEFAFGVGYYWGENNDSGATAGLDLRIGLGL